MVLVTRFGSRLPQRLSRARVCAIIGDELRMFGPDLDELTPHTYRTGVGRRGCGTVLQYK